MAGKFIYNLYHNRKCPIYGNGQALRKYLYVSDACDAYMMILTKGEVGQIYEMGSDHEYSALEMGTKIVEQVKPGELAENWIDYVEDRKFHDKRYLVNQTTLKELGWVAKTSFTDGLKKTIEWYIEYAIPEEHWLYDDRVTIGKKN